MTDAAETLLKDRIRACADRAGGSGALAQATGIPRSTLDTYLSGQSEPNVTRAALIAKVGRVDAGWLVTGEGPPPDGTATGFGEDQSPFLGGLHRDLVIAMLKTMEGFFEKKRLELNADERVRLFTALYVFAEKELAGGRQPDFAGMLDFFYNSRG